MHAKQATTSGVNTEHADINIYRCRHSPGLAEVNDIKDIANYKFPELGKHSARNHYDFKMAAESREIDGPNVGPKSRECRLKLLQ